VKTTSKIQSGNLALSFYRRSCECPNDPALFVHGRTYPYGELAIKAGKIAAWVKSNVRGENPRIGILTSRGLEAYAGILGTVWAGGAYVPFNPQFPKALLQEMFESVSLDALIVDTLGLSVLHDLNDFLPPALLLPCDEAMPEWRSRVCGTSALEKIPSLGVPQPVSPGAIAYLMFTSGTTGKPKGIPVTVGNTMHFLQVMQDRYEVMPIDRLSQFTELIGDLSVFDLFMAWSNGASLWVVPEDMRMSPAVFIRKHRLTIWFSIPSLIGFMGRTKQLKPKSFPSLRLSLFCGEALPQKSAEAWQQAAPLGTIENLYGPTEATVACLLQRYGEEGGITESRGVVAIGKPYPGMFAAVVNSSLEFLSPGVSGELVISGPQVTPGYWRNPVLTNCQYLMLDHPTFGQTRWYRTGDQVYEDERGIFHYLGRIDNQVKVRGYRIELEEIEYHLREVSGCANVAVVVWPVIDGLGRGIAAAVGDPHLSVQELKKKMSSRVPYHMVPGKILLLEKMPRSSNGKISHKAILPMLEDANSR
jgi:amino acid adenylation domain-containing protein